MQAAMRMMTRANLPLDRRDAIHRAVLSGLLGNIGQKGEQAEYLGGRNTRFFIHPGSSQFNRKPPWVMAAEIVETTKLYARIVGPIRPEWIERLAEHLIHAVLFRAALAAGDGARRGL